MQDSLKSTTVLLRKQDRFHQFCFRVFCQIGVLLSVLAIGTSSSPLRAEDRYAFQLPAIDGSVSVLSREHCRRCNVVFFFGNQCPLARLYAKRLQDLSRQFADADVGWIGINSNQQDSMEEIKAFADELGITLTLAKDYDNAVADRYQATRTAEVFVFDAELKVKYQGRIDDQYSPGISRANVNREFLADAIESVINRRPVVVPQTDPVGCLIGRVKQPVARPTVTYANQISRLLNKHCVECHRSGEIGPFAMQDFDEIRGWAEMIVEVVDNGRMPPWHASGGYRQFVNERRLTTAEKQLFRDWLNQGAPFGNADKLPKQPTFTSGWRLPKQPDQVVAMSRNAFDVPAEGTVEYQYFVVDPGFTEDVWITAAEVIPGNFAVVHHSIVFVRPPDGTPFRGIGWLAAYVPGQSPPRYDERMGRLVPAGSKLVFQQHYTPNGKSAEDLTRVGLVFGDPDLIETEIFTVAALNQEFEIPSNRAKYEVRAQVPWFPNSGRLLSISPHMHYRGKAFDFFCRFADHTEQILEVPNYDFNWQHNYRLSEPVDLAGVDELYCQFEFDNSIDNPFNPDPDQMVFWGDQTWEEMAVAFFDIAAPRNRRFTRSTDTERETRVENQTKKFVDDFFLRFDSNHDGKLVRDELPKSIGRFRFHHLDSDGNGLVDKNELISASRKRFED